MHLNLHKKVYKKVLLIANGYEPYHEDISYLAETKFLKNYKHDELSFFKDEFSRHRQVNESIDIAQS